MFTNNRLAKPESSTGPDTTPLGGGGWLQETLAAAHGSGLSTNRHAPKCSGTHSGCNICPEAVSMLARVSAAHFFRTLTLLLPKRLNLGASLWTSGGERDAWAGREAEEDKPGSLVPDRDLEELCQKLKHKWCISAEPLITANEGLMEVLNWTDKKFCLKLS